MIEVEDTATTFLNSKYLMVMKLTKMFGNKPVESLTQGVTANLTCSNTLVNLVGYRLDHHH